MIKVSLIHTLRDEAAIQNIRSIHAQTGGDFLIRNW
jgi:hypothetical protein